MRLPTIEQRVNEPLTRTRFSPVLVVSARPWRELARIRFGRDSDQLGKVRFAYFRADGVESKVEWRAADASAEATLFIDAQRVAGAPSRAVPFGHAILHGLGIEEPRIVWRNPELTEAEPQRDTPPSSFEIGEPSSARAEPAFQSHG